MTELSWKHVTVIVAFFVAIAVLAVTGHDTGAFITVGLGVLGALGLLVAQGAATKETASATHAQSNGNLSRLMDIIERQGAMLAQATPPAAPPATGSASEPPPAA